MRSTPMLCLRSGRPSRALAADIDELAALLAPLVDHPKALGIALSLYDPSLDPDRSSAARLVSCSRSRSSAGDDMPRRLEIVGAPSSAGAYAPGQERAPLAYRAAGLPAFLQERGIAVTDRGDVPGFRWRIDPDHMRAMNADAAAGVASAVADEVAAGLSDGSAVLVLGGDCTVEIGTVAGASRDTPDVGLVYIDYDTDMNTPQSVEDGALDWMGVAHLLGLPEPFPVSPASARGCRCCARTRSSCSRTAARQTSSDGRSTSSASRRSRWRRSTSDPAGSARGVVDGWARRFDRLLVHVDADVLDFLDFPIAEETRRYRGLRFEQLVAVLRELVAAPNWTTLTICEVNPDHDPDGSSMRRLSEALADVLSGAPGLAG